MELDAEIVATVNRAIADTRSHDAMRDQPWLTDRRVFRFCQYLRSTAGAEIPPRGLLPYLELWWNAVADALNGDEDHNGDPISLTWELARGQFCAIWPKAEIYPVGDFWMGMARLCEPNEPAVQQYRDPALRRLASAMYHASRRNDEGTFYMAGKDAGRIIGRSQPIGRAAILALLADGTIEQLDRGHTGHSPQYRWTGSF